MRLIPQFNVNGRFTIPNPNALTPVPLSQGSMYVIKQSNPTYPALVYDDVQNSRHLRGGEGGQDWLERVLKERGLKGVRLITSDACIGLAESAAEFFPDAAWQRCVVHWYRNIFSHVPSTKVREIAAMLKAIHASEDLAAAREKAMGAP